MLGLFKIFYKEVVNIPSDIKKKWKKSVSAYYIRRSIIKDLNRLKNSIKKSNYDFDRYYISFKSKFSKGVVKFTKIKYFLKTLDLKLNNTYDENKINKHFDKFISKLDGRIIKYLDNKEKKIINYPEEISKLPKEVYSKEKLKLQIELLKLQEWCVKNNKKVAIVFEGRDAAGKGSSIKRFTEYLNPDNFRVVSLGIPTKEESNNWFERYEKRLPNEGEIVFFDRSWYNRAVIEPTMGYCDEDQYTEFMNKVNDWERDIINNGTILIKFWFSIRQEKQLERFDIRKKSPLKYWKYSPNDEKTITKWDIITKYKNQMYQKTSTDISPWIIIKSNDKRVARLNSMKYVLSEIDYKKNKSNKSNIKLDENVIRKF